MTATPYLAGEEAVESALATSVQRAFAINFVTPRRLTPPSTGPADVRSSFCAGVRGGGSVNANVVQPQSLKRVVIIGSGGAGKTSLAMDLGKKLGIPVHHLDAIFWRPGWKPMERREFEAAQHDLIGAPAWVIDGNYGGTMELRLAAADTIIFMDLPRVTCLLGALKRRIQQRSRPDKVVENRERLTLEYLLWIWNYRSTRMPGILKRLEDLRDEKTIIILRSRAERAAFLAAA